MAPDFAMWVRIGAGVHEGAIGRLAPCQPALVQARLKPAAVYGSFCLEIEHSIGWCICGHSEELEDKKERHTRDG